MLKVGSKYKVTNKVKLNDGDYINDILIVLKLKDVNNYVTCFNITKGRTQDWFDTRFHNGDFKKLLNKKGEGYER